jgi:hypothetical protein
MTSRMNTLLVACGLTISLASLPTLGQVAPPPTKPAKEVPTFTPAPKTAPVAKPKTDAPRPKPSFNAKRSTGNIEAINTNIPYPKLAQPGPDGRILRLRQSPDILALRSNPNVGPASVERIMPIVYSRRYRMELKVIDNLDLYWQLTAGLIENMNMTNLNEMSKVAEMLKPLVAPNTLSQELENRGILTRTQGGMNRYIVREYKKSITDEIQVLDGDSGLEEVMRFVLEDSIQEADLTYNAMLAEAISQIAGLVDETNASSTAAQALRSFEKPLAGEPEQQFTELKEFDAEFRKLPYEEAIAIFRAMREHRKFPEISPTIKPINVLHEGKSVMKGDFGVIVKDGKGKVVKDTYNEDQKESQSQSPAEKPQEE